MLMSMAKAAELSPRIFRFFDFSIFRFFDFSIFRFFDFSIFQFLTYDTVVAKSIPPCVIFKIPLVRKAT